MTEIFISHCPKDKQLAETLCGFLTQRGYQCMTSSGFNARGQYSSVSSVAALSSMKIFILIYSRNSASSTRISRQLELAVNRPGTAVVPYRTDNAPIIAKFANLLMNNGRIDAYPANGDLRLEQLYTAVSGIINGTVPAPVYSAAQFRPVKDTTPTSLLAACAVVFVGSVIATAAVRQVKTRLNKEPETEPVVMQETAPEPTRETATFDCKVIYIDKEYTGEYSGEIGENGLPDGVGEFRWASSEAENEQSLVYSGEFVNGAITGKGKCSFEYENGDKYVYEGYLENGMMKGRGSCTFTDESDEDITMAISEGLWYSYNSISDFKKTEYYTDGTVREFKGELKDNMWSGSGFLRITYSTGEVKEEYYQGTWNEGDLEGKIVKTQQYANGDHYEYTGGYSDNSWNGEGVKIYYYASDEKKSDKYEGRYVNGKLTGAVTKTVEYTNGDVKVYQGDYADSSFVGHTTLTHTYASGKVAKKVFEGEWSNGDANGSGVLTKYYRKPKEDGDTTTKVTEGVWTDGTLSGEITSTETLLNGDVKVYKGSYSDGDWNGSGVLTYTYANKRNKVKSWVIEGSWENGKLSDTVKKTVNYKNGDLEEYSGGYSDSKKNGKGTTTFTDKDSGKKWVEEGTYADDVLTNGTRTYYGKDGAAESTEKYLNGVLTETK